MPESQIAAMKNLGFNTIHLYAEGADANYPNSGTNTPGYEALAVDKIVQYCQDQGLYCIIVAGGSQAWIDGFWQFYAPRYANYSNVIYEIANEPASTISMAVNEDCYSTIRTYAPNTPVLLFTDINVYGTGAGTSVLQKIQTFNQAEFGNPNEVWTNIAYAFHGYAPDALTGAVGVQTIINGGYPVFMTGSQQLGLGHKQQRRNRHPTDAVAGADKDLLDYISARAALWRCRRRHRPDSVREPGKRLRPFLDSLTTKRGVAGCPRRL